MLPELFPFWGAMSKGIKESLEVFAAVEETAISITDAAQDGFALADIAHAFGPIKAVDAAIDNIGEVDDEMKDLDEAEVRELASAAFRAVRETAIAIKASREAFASQS